MLQKRKDKLDRINEEMKMRNNQLQYTYLDFIYCFIYNDGLMLDSSEIKSEVGCSKTTSNKRLSELEEKGILERKKTGYGTADVWAMEELRNRNDFNMLIQKLDIEYNESQIERNIL